LNHKSSHKFFDFFYAFCGSKKNHIMKIIQLGILLFCIGILHTSFAQIYTYDKKYPVSELKKDLAILKEQLELNHIGLYTYTPKSEMDQYFQQLEANITSPMTDIEFLRLLFPLNAKIANEHTKIIPSAGYINTMKNFWKVLPLEVYWDQEQLYVVEDHSQKQLIKEGSSIKSINGEDASELFKRLAAILWRDGYNTTAPNAYLADRFYQYYAFLIGLPTTFNLEVVDPEGERRSIELKAQTLATNKKIKEKRYGIQKSWIETDIPALALSINNNIATMTIRSFDKAIKKLKKQKFKKFYKDAFTKINAAGVEHLLIDLRDNGGGDPMPTIELFAYLHKEPFTFYESVTSNVQRIPKGLYDIGFLDRIAFPIGFKKKGDLYESNWITRLIALPGLKPSKPNTPYYSGKVYVLTNANSFSASGEMTAILKEHNRATFIGEEPGGNPNENVSGIQYFMTLPATSNRILMPFIRFKMNVGFENTGRGVLPDYPVRPSIDDILNGHDKVMEFTLDLIEKM